MIACGIAAWFLLALAVGLIAFSVNEDHDTRWTKSPMKEVLNWLYTVPSIYRFLAAAVIGCCGGALAVATVRLWKSDAGAGLV